MVIPQVPKRFKNLSYNSAISRAQVAAKLLEMASHRICVSIPLPGIPKNYLNCARCKPQWTKLSPNGTEKEKTSHLLF